MKLPMHLAITLIFSRLLSAVDPPPLGQYPPSSAQTVSTQVWIPGHWDRNVPKDIWQPGRWEMAPVSGTGVHRASIPLQNTAPIWISERWIQTTSSWIRYAGRWSNELDVALEIQPITTPIRTVVVAYPKETVVIERPAPYPYVSLNVSMANGMGGRLGGWHFYPLGFGFGYGSPTFYGGYGGHR